MPASEVLTRYADGASRCQGLMGSMARQHACKARWGNWCPLMLMPQVAEQLGFHLCAAEVMRALCTAIIPALWPLLHQQAHWQLHGELCFCRERHGQRE